MLPDNKILLLCAGWAYYLPVPKLVTFPLPNPEVYFIIWLSQLVIQTLNYIKRFFYFYGTVHTGPGQLSCYYRLLNTWSRNRYLIHWVPDALSLRIKQPRHKGHCLPSSCAKINKTWIYISTSYIFMAQFLTKHKDNFTTLYLQQNTFRCCSVRRHSSPW